MRELINYIKQCFCNHELKIEEQTITIIGSRQSMYQDYKCIMVSQTCFKCGYHKSYSKYQLNS